MKQLQIFDVQHNFTLKLNVNNSCFQHDIPLFKTTQINDRFKSKLLSKLRLIDTFHKKKPLRKNARNKVRVE